MKKYDHELLKFFFNNGRVMCRGKSRRKKGGTSWEGHGKKNEGKLKILSPGHCKG